MILNGEQLRTLGAQSIVDELAALGHRSPFSYPPRFFSRRKRWPVILYPDPPDVADPICAELAIHADDCSGTFWGSLTRAEQECYICYHMARLLSFHGGLRALTRSREVTILASCGNDVFGSPHAIAMARLATRHEPLARRIITCHLNHEGGLWYAFWRRELKRPGNVRYQLKTQAEIAEALDAHFRKEGS